MRICLIGKYPPIQGGVSAQTYWTAWGLASRGHQVHVVTNALEVADEYRLQLSADDFPAYAAEFAETGGFIRVAAPAPADRRQHGHIPFANPFVTKLAGRAASVIEEQGCEVIIAHYLEPYAVAAHLAASWTGCPLIIRHAGSDLDRLMRDPDLAATYVRVLRSATAVATTPALLTRFLGLGIAREALYRCPPYAIPPCFSPDADPMTPEEIHALAAPDGPAEPHDPTWPVLGMYGKPGEAKGTFDLIAALGRVACTGARFTLLLASGHGMRERLRAEIAAAGLTDRTRTLPFIPHWRVPAFIRACTAVCFLERDFPVHIHGPVVAREILSCGTCLVLSGEIADKQSYRGRLVDGENVVLVRDPKDHHDLAARLASIVAAPGHAGEIGAAGHSVAADFNRFEDFVDAWEALIGSPAGRRMAEPDSDTERVTEMLPWSAEMFGELLDEVAADFARLHPAACGLDLVGAFCDYLEARADSFAVLLGREAGYLRDVVGYQRARLWAGRLDGAEWMVPPELTPTDLDEWSAATRPRARGEIRVQSFTHDVTPLFSPTPTHARDGGVTVCFSRLPNLAHSEIRINTWTRQVLDLCDGTRTVAEISERLPRVTENDVVAVLARMRRAGLTTV